MRQRAFGGSRLRQLIALIALIIALQGAALLGQNQRFLYVANWDPSSNSISGFSADPATGLLTPLSGFPIPAHGHPEHFAVHPNNKFLYIANEDAGAIYAYSIDPSTGGLTSIAGSPFAAGPGSNWVILDPTGRFAYINSFASNKVYGYSVDATTGTLVPIPGSPFPAQGVTGRDEPGALATDPAGKFLFTANYRSSSVTVYNINATNGALTFVPGSPFPTPNSGGLAFGTTDPTGRFFYLADGYQSRVDAWTIAATGSLTPISGSPFSTGPTGGYPTTVAVDPNGEFAYVTNELGNSIAIYQIDPTSGTLTPISGSPFPTGASLGPTALTFSPEGTFAYVDNQQTGGVSLYSVNAATGALTQIPGATFPTGTQPVAIALVNGGPPPLISPDHGGNTGTVTVRITGTGVESGAVVKLIGSGSDILGTSTSLLSTGLLSTTFDLTGAFPGPRTVTVTNLDKTSVVLTNGFTIQHGGVPSVSVGILGPGKIRIGSTQAYYLSITNSGSIDAPFVEADVPGLSSLSSQTTTLGTLPAGPFSGLGLSTQFIGTIGARSTINVPFTIVGSFSSCINVQSNSRSIQTTDPCAKVEAARNSLDQYLTILYEGRLANLLAWMHAILPLSEGGTGQCFNVTIQDSAVFCSDYEALDAVFAFLIGVAESASNLLCGLEIASGCSPDCALPSEIDLLGTSVETLEKTVADLQLIFGMPVIPLAQLQQDYIDVYGNLNQVLRLPSAPAFPNSSYPPLTMYPPDQSTSLMVCPVSSLDPNDLVGDSGFGQANWISGSRELSYSAYFTNEQTATAPAQSVTISDQLDPTKIDISTLTLQSLTLGSTQLSFPDIPLVLLPLNTNVDLRPATNLIANMTSNLNTATGALTVNFTSIDPATGKPTTDPTIGLLNPGVGGSVLFTASPKTALATGTVISDSASIVFDLNSPITTPTWSNTLDNAAPTSKVTALPASQSNQAFPVSWSGTDVGSGILNYTIYVSDNGTPFTPWQANVPTTQATYTGQVGHTYGFYSIATDGVGNLEAAKTSPDTSTQIVPPATTTTLQASTLAALAGQSVTLNATVSGPTGNTTVPTGVVTFSSGTTTLGTATVNSSGVATLAIVLAVGADSVSAQYSGDASFASSVSGAVSVTVARIATTVVVTSIASPANLNASITFTATVHPAVGSGVPTGTVTFSDGTTALGTGTLGNSGTTAYSTAALTAGTHTITAVYSGDGIYLGSTSSAFTQTVNLPGYSLSATPATLTISDGGSGQTTFTVTPVGGYKSQITFTCSGLPAYATCAFSPSSLTPDGTNTAVTSTLTIATSVKTASAPRPVVDGNHGNRDQFSKKLLALTLFGLPSLIWARRRIRKRLNTLQLIVVYSLMLGLAAMVIQGCGGTNTNTPRGTDIITVTASGGGGAQSASITLIVQ